jgi:hypothetical protein
VEERARRSQLRELAPLALHLLKNTHHLFPVSNIVKKDRREVGGASRQGVRMNHSREPIMVVQRLNAVKRNGCFRDLTKKEREISVKSEKWKQQRKENKRDRKKEHQMVVHDSCASSSSLRSQLRHVIMKRSSSIKVPVGRMKRSAEHTPDQRSQGTAANHKERLAKSREIQRK